MENKDFPDIGKTFYFFNALTRELIEKVTINSDVFRTISIDPQLEHTYLAFLDKNGSPVLIRDHIILNGSIHVVEHIQFKHRYQESEVRLYNVAAKTTFALALDRFQDESILIPSEILK